MPAGSGPGSSSRSHGANGARPPTAAARNPVHESRWVFGLLCVYIASQGYTVPLVPVGPWPLWPGLPDLALGALIVAWVMIPPPPAVTGVRRTSLRIMGGITVVAIVSYVLWTLLFANFESLSFGFNQQGPQFGLFEVVRLLQVLALFWIALHIPYTAFRLMVLRRVVTGTFLFVSMTVLITFQNLVSPGVFSPLLPRDQETAGAWWHFVHNFDGYGLGAISYTHAYVAAQVTLLLGLTLHLRGHERSSGNALMVMLALAATLVSGSRAGFAGLMLVALAFLLAKSPRWLVHCAIGVALLGAGAFLYLSSQPSTGDTGTPIASILQHQLNAFQPFESENLVGRDEIWSGRIDYMNEHPWRWFTGWGLGSSPDTGPGLSPHMLPFQIASELGVGMLAVVALACLAMLRTIWQREDGDHGFFWVTIALFLSSATQETFYPVPSTGYFLGFYLVALAIVMRPEIDPVADPARQPVRRWNPRPRAVGSVREELAPDISA